jgi:hypothetical protein
MFSLLRASAPRALDFPALHSEVRAAIVARFQSGPHDLLPRELWSDVEAALALAREYDIIEVRFKLYLKSNSSSSIVDTSWTLLHVYHYLSF